MKWQCSIYFIYDNQAIGCRWRGDVRNYYYNDLYQNVIYSMHARSDTNKYINK